MKIVLAIIKMPHSNANGQNGRVRTGWEEEEGAKKGVGVGSSLSDQNVSLSGVNKIVSF